MWLYLLFPRLIWNYFIRSVRISIELIYREKTNSKEKKEFTQKQEEEEDKNVENEKHTRTHKLMTIVELIMVCQMMEHPSIYSYFVEHVKVSAMLNYN